MSFVKVMLAEYAELADITRFPVLVSPKIDGVRAHVEYVLDSEGNGSPVLLSRSNKPIPNKFCQQLFARAEYLGFDGELTVGDPTAKDVFRTTTSGVMSVEGEPDVTFHVFDSHLIPRKPFCDRLDYVACRQLKDRACRLHRVPQFLVHDADMLAHRERSFLADGWEGMIVRDPDAPYKQGRSTLKEGWMLKVKRFTDAEAAVIGMDELIHKDGSKSGMLGALVVAMDDVTFRIGTGFDAETRRHVWMHPDQYLRRIVKFKYLPQGIKKAPRHPVFLGWRDPIDT